MENGPFIDDFPIKTSIYKGFSMAMLNNQMVYTVYSPNKFNYLLKHFILIRQLYVHFIDETRVERVDDERYERVKLALHVQTRTKHVGIAPK
jgi:hypothetical protein